MKGSLRKALVVVMIAASIVQLTAYGAGANGGMYASMFGVPLWSTPTFSSPWWSSPYWSTPYWSTPYWSSPYWSTPYESTDPGGEGESPKPMTLAEGIPSGWTTGTVEVTLLQAGNAENTYYVLDGVGPSLFDIEPITIDKEGRSLLEYWSTSSMVEEMPHNLADVCIDRTAPTANAAGDASVTGVNKVTITGSDPLPTGVNESSGVAKVFYKVDGGAAQSVMGTQAEVQVFGVGAHAVEYWAEDGAGNVGTPKTEQVTVWNSTGLTLLGSSTSPAYNGSTKLTARLKVANGAAVSGKTVLFEYWTGSSWAWAGTANTDSAGLASKWVGGLQSKRAFRARFAGSAPYKASTSLTMYVTPKSLVGTPKAPKTMRRTRSYAVSGVLMPRHTAGSYPVRIYKWKKTSSGKWKSYGYVKAKASNYYSNSKYAAKIRLKSAGKWRLRAYAPADSGHAAQWSSGYDYVTVK